MFGWEKSPLRYHIFWKKHPRAKCQKVDPLYFSILMGVYFLHFFPKTTLSISKWQKSHNCNFGVLCQTQTSIFFHLFNLYQEIIPKNFIWRLPHHSSIILKPIFVNFSEICDILPSNWKWPRRAQNSSKFDSVKSFEGFIPISFI